MKSLMGAPCNIQMNILCVTSYLSHMEVDHDADSDFDKEYQEEEGKEGAEHPGGLLPGAAAAEEAHDGDEGPHPQEDVGAQVVVSPLISRRLQIQVAATL